MAGGRPPKEKSFYNALSVALREARTVGVDGQKVPNLRIIADKLVEAAMAGESWAIREVADRIDGKPVQAIDHSGHIDTNLSQATDAELEAIALARPQHEGKTIN
jgi:hypothetical protein